MNYQPGKIITVYGAATDSTMQAALQRLDAHLRHLSKATVHLQTTAQWPAARLLRLVVGGLTVGLTVEGDVDLRKALERVRKQRETNEQETARTNAKLGNADFTSKAPPEVVAEHTQRVQTLRQEHELLTSSERQLQGMIA